MLLGDSEDLAAGAPRVLGGSVEEYADRESRVGQVDVVTTRDGDGPDVTRGRPTMIRIVVDFPAPFGPRNPVTRPAWAVKLTSSTAVKVPYFLVTPSTVIIGCPPAAGSRGPGSRAVLSRRQ